MCSLQCFIKMRVNSMKAKLIFLTFCIITTLILLLITLKIDPIKNGIHKEWKYTYHSNDIDANIFSITNYIIEANCNPSYIIWIVTSSASNHLYRTTLRYAYSSEMLKTLNITRVFLLGLPKEKNLQKYILKESQKYGDLLQGYFLDDYRNLTLKHLMGLGWSSRNCSATFLIKSDDDIVLNVFEVSQFIQQQTIKHNSIYGYVLKNMKPVRILSNKWFTSKEEFPADIYPDFLSGWFYITSVKVAQMLVLESTKLKRFFWIDDVFITGILRKACSIELNQLNNFYATDYRYLECCIHGMERKLKCEFIAGPDGGKKNLHVKFRKFSEFCQWNCTERSKEQAVLKTCVAAYEENINAINARAEIHYI